MAALDRHGRLIVPASLRRQMGWQVGEKLSFSVENGALRVASRRQALDEALAEIRQHIPPGVSLVDELLHERREEVRREEEETLAWRGKGVPVAEAAQRG